eukprot:scaffold17307_cov170-Amphora_coffeaeformis.AAC.2
MSYEDAPAGNDSPSSHVLSDVLGHPNNQGAEIAETRHAAFRHPSLGKDAEKYTKHHNRSVLVPEETAQ